MVDRRSFSQKKRAEICLRQDGKCTVCGAKLAPGKFEIDHIAAVVHEGSNDDDNLRAICTVPCHRAKTRQDVQALHKGNRIIVGGRQRKGRPMDGTRASGIRKRMNGQVEKWQ